MTYAEAQQKYQSPADRDSLQVYVDARDAGVKYDPKSKFRPGGGLSAGWKKPLTPEQEQSQEIQKLLYQHSKPYMQRYEEWGEKHPVQKFGVERAADFASTMFPYGKVLRVLPRVGEALGSAVDAYQKSGGMGSWGEGAAGGQVPRIAPEYRHPLKGQMLKEMKERFETPYIATRGGLQEKLFKGTGRRRHMSDFEFGREQDPAGGVTGPLSTAPASKKVRENWEMFNQIVAEEGKGAPYQVTLFRGERGKRSGHGGPVPGRGRYHATRPGEAMDYADTDVPKDYWAPKTEAERKRWMMESGGPYDKYHSSSSKYNLDWARLKGVRVEDVTLNKPLVLDKAKKNFEGLKDKLNLTEKDKATADALDREWKNAPESRARYSRIEKFWARKARDAGYDSLVEHGEGGTQVITLEPARLKGPLPK